MSWKPFTVRFGARRPRFLPEIAEPEACAAAVHRGLDWMHPDVALTGDTAVVRLTMAAASAEAALAHMRGSYRSALTAAGIQQVGLWPLYLLSVEEGGPGPAAAPDREPVAAGAAR